jgi:hypothetical protein
MRSTASQIAVPATPNIIFTFPLLRNGKIILMNN